MLQGKYFDWCSARLAERFLQLSPDEIYERAERAERSKAAPGIERPALARGVLPAAGSPSFRRLVEQVTDVLAAELDLPSFEEWAAAYRASPGRYDAEILGMWRNRS